jgi:hypothetical protein
LKLSQVYQTGADSIDHQREACQISDREVVEQIRETPYLQYFMGMEGYEDKEPFDPSIMVHFRKRLNGQLIEKANEILFREYRNEELKKNGRNDGSKRIR